MQEHKKNIGFTLIELLIAIVIISIIAAVIFVALDPFTRFRARRDSKRLTNIAALANAIKADETDNGGGYLEEIASLNKNQIYMIGTDAAGCDDYNSHCDVDVSGDADCVNLMDLERQEYIKTIPVSPNGAGEWTGGHTGYTLSVTPDSLIIRACESENSDEIFILR